MNRCKECDVIIVPITEIEALRDYPMELCWACLKEGVEQLERIQRNVIQP